MLHMQTKLYCPWQAEAQLLIPELASDRSVFVCSAVDRKENIDSEVVSDRTSWAGTLQSVIKSDIQADPSGLDITSNKTRHRHRRRKMCVLDLVWRIHFFQAGSDCSCIVTRVSLLVSLFCLKWMHVKFGGESFFKPWRSLEYCRGAWAAGPVRSRFE